MAPAGSVAPAEHVDHVRPLGMGGERFDPANLQPLCRSCHSRKTVRFG
jgi:5-methylcytosine-specific restriction endonuclease McrA